MINNDRIVPVQNIDLLSLYQLIIKASGVNASVLVSDTVAGNFSIADEGVYLANEPVKSITLGDSDGGGR